jgi:hypothetical protein
MGWSIGGPDQRGRFVGYGVPAYCDHPKCAKEIDRGLAYVCGGEPFGGDVGCGLFFCEDHRRHHALRDGNVVELCPRCDTYRSTYVRIKPEHPRWLRHMLTDDSWAEWRAENPKQVSEMATALEAA